METTNVWEWLNASGGAVYAGEAPYEMTWDAVDWKEFSDPDLESPYITHGGADDRADSDSPLVVSAGDAGAVALLVAPASVPFRDWLELTFKDVLL